MDLIRDLLMKVAADDLLDGTRWVHYESLEELGIEGHSMMEIGYHLNLLIEAGYLKGRPGIEQIPPINKLTWQGHEFLDNIRDPGIWNKTKARVSGLPGVAISIVAEIAKAEIKRKLGLS